EDDASVHLCACRLTQRILSAVPVRPGPQAPGGARRSNSRCETRTSTGSAFLAWPVPRRRNPIEPPWYGPVCPVVWEGRSREAPPYPDQQGLGCADSQACAPYPGPLSLDALPAHSLAAPVSL